MPESGGTTTQSGILYQNSITALYLGRLVDPVDRKPSEQVVGVRAESWDEVDDTMVSYADGHRDYIQAKEAISDEAWTGLWKDFLEQFRADGFAADRDRLLLICGDSTEKVRNTREAAGRGRGASTSVEWFQRLSEAQRDVVDDVAKRIKVRDADVLHSLFRCVVVEVMSLGDIERDRVHFWVPQNSCGTLALFAVLRDRVGGNARWRSSFDRQTLLETLREVFPDCRIAGAAALSAIDDSVRRCNALLRQHKATLGETGIHCRRAVVDAIAQWIVSDDACGAAAMLLDQAGAGKTVVMSDLMRHLEAASHQVLAVKADLQLAGVESSEEMQERLQLPETFERTVEQLAARGPVFVLFDQIDALSLALAHNHRTLALLLDTAARVLSIPGVRVVMSCRLFDRNNDPRLKRFRTARNFELGVLSDPELVPVLDAAGIDPHALPRETLDLIRVPLHLDLFLLTRGKSDEAVSLQDLYRVLLDELAFRSAADAPSPQARAAVLFELMRRMQSTQRSSVPDRVLDPGLRAAAEWLGSHGIVVRSSDGWAFRHQTMLAYLFAVDFVESGVSLIDHIRRGTQALPARTELLHVLQHLHGVDPVRALQELNDLYAADDVRFHLRDLALRWFGSLSRPNAAEVAWAATLLDKKEGWRRFWRAAHGNPIWFDRLRDAIDEALEVFDDRAREVLRFVGSIALARQRAAGELFLRLLRREEDWGAAVTALSLGWFGWTDPLTIDLMEELFERGFALPNGRKFEQFIPIDPERTIRLLLRAAERDDVDGLRPSGFVAEELSSDAFRAYDALSGVGSEEPLTHPIRWLEALVPWLGHELAAGRFDLVEMHKPLFGRLELSAPEPGTTPEERVYAPLVKGVAKALHALRPQPEFATWFRRVSGSSAVRLQEAAADALCDDPTRVWAASAPSAAEIALAAEFLLSPSRRLPFDSKAGSKLIERFRRHLNSETIDRLRQLFFAEADREPLEQQRTARRKIVAWLLPDRASEEPVRALSSLKFLDMLLPPKRRKRDSSPLLYRDESGTHAAKVRRIRQETTEDPERALRLFGRIRSSVHADFVRAFLDGLPATVGFQPAYAVLRRFLIPAARLGVPAAFAWWLMKRGEAIPDEVLDLLESWVRDPVRDAFQAITVSRIHYVGTDRGASFLALARLLRFRGEEGADERRWRLFDYVAAEGTIALKAAAIGELIPELVDRRSETLDLFDRLFTAEDEAALLAAPRLVAFLQAALWRSFRRIQHLIVTLAEADDPLLSERGAHLLALAATSPGSLDEREIYVARRLVDALLDHGTATHRVRLAMTVATSFSRSIAPYCLLVLTSLLDDPLPEVRQAIAEVLPRLGRRDLVESREFFFRYASSRAMLDGIDAFASFLLEHGLASVDDSLSLVETILGNEQVQRARWYAGRELIQFVLRVEMFPAATAPQRRRAMNLFDALMAQLDGVADDILVEWDRQ